MAAEPLGRRLRGRLGAALACSWIYSPGSSAAPSLSPEYASLAGLRLKPWINQDELLQSKKIQYSLQISLQVMPNQQVAISVEKGLHDSHLVAADQPIHISCSALAYKAPLTSDQQPDTHVTGESHGFPLCLFLASQSLLLAEERGRRVVQSIYISAEIAPFTGAFSTIIFNFNG